MATVDVSEQTLGAAIQDNDIVLVDFWAEWCPPCRAFGPVYEAASAEHSDVVFAKVDTEANQALSQALRITSIPTLMAFREQVLVFSQPGALPAPMLEQVIDAVKALDMDEVRAKIAAAQEAEAAAVQAPSAD